MMHSGAGPATFDDPARLADAIVERVGKKIVLALPLGLGKANHIANALYDKASADPSLKLTIFTALTLEAPRAKNELERRFLDPIAQRVFAGYPALHYATAIRKGSVPANIEINEFFFEAGQWLDSLYAQQHYISANYTHALRYVLDRGVNVVGQLVAHRAAETARPYSLSCNPDLTCDLLKLRREGSADFMFCGQTNSELPFMRGDAIGRGERIRSSARRRRRRTFRCSRRRASQCRSPIMRRGSMRRVPCRTAARCRSASARWATRSRRAWCCGRSKMPNIANCCRVSAISRPDDSEVCTEPFDIGLYGCSELFVEGMLDLYRCRHPQARSRRRRAAWRLFRRLTRLLSRAARNAAGDCRANSA